jgi:hypothetical protein
VSAKDHVNELMAEITKLQKERTEMELTLAEFTKNQTKLNSSSGLSSSSVQVHQQTTHTEYKSSFFRRPSNPMKVSSNDLAGQMKTGEVIKEGYLNKRSPKLFKPYQIRYFVLLEGLQLTYYLQVRKIVVLN